MYPAPPVRSTRSMARLLFPVVNRVPDALTDSDIGRADAGDQIARSPGTVETAVPRRFFSGAWSNGPPPSR
jgi:hypothetical protein